MTKPQKYQIEGEVIFRLRRATAEQLADEGLIKLVDGGKLDTRYPLTPKGVAFFNFTGRNFKWVEDDKLEDDKPKKSLTFRQRVAKAFLESCDPSSPSYDSHVYPDDEPPATPISQTVSASS